MATGSNMIITNTGLSKTARLLIDKRNYAPDKVTLVGHPLVTVEGALSGMTGTSYALHEGFKLNEDSVKIMFKGIFRNNNDEAQTFLTLTNPSDNSIFLSFKFEKESFKIFKGDTQISGIEIPALSDGIEIQGEFTQKSELTYSFILTIGEERYEFDRDFWEETDLTGYTAVLFGHDPSDVNSFWCGSIFLSDFFLYNGESLIYAPSTTPEFQFTKILVSDGTVELKDDTTPLYKHVFEFPIEEYPIAREYNQIFLKSTINESAYLNINQIGLYATNEKGTFLFGIVTGLSLQKKKDLGYDLIFKININLGVVNTYAYPKITVKDEKYVTINNLSELEEVHANVITDMERAITKNSTLIGYEQDAVFYKLFNDSVLADNVYSNVHKYARIVQHIHPEYIKTFDKKRLTFIGNPQLKGSVASEFSVVNYITIPCSLILDLIWDMEFSFKIPKTMREEVLYTFCNYAGAAKMIFGITANNYLYIKIPGLFTRNLFKITDSKKTFVRITFNGFTYKFYKKVSGDSGYSKVTEIASSQVIGELGKCYVGVLSENGNISDYLIGALDLNDLYIQTDVSTFSPSKITYKNTEVEDCYCFVGYPADFYKVKNLKGTSNSAINYFEGSITGNKDSLDFSNPDGCTLIVKANLEDRSNKLILAKTNIENEETYFTLEFTDFTLRFKLYMEDGILELSKSYTENGSYELVGTPTVITVVADNTSGSPVFALYINGQKADEKEYATKNYLNSKQYKFTNYIEDISEATKNYVLNIVDFKGILNAEEIHYTTGLLGVTG